MRAAKVMSRTDLHEAVENGDVEGVDLLLQRSTDEINTPDFQGRTPAYLAAWKGMDDILSVLIMHGADLNIGKSTGATPTFIAASEGHTTTLNLLASNGADVNKTKTNIEKDSPMTIAAYAGHVDCLRVLIHHGANERYANSFGKTSGEYFRERHKGDLDKLMIEEKKKVALQQLRVAISTNIPRTIRRRVAEARKAFVPEVTLNMLGWQSALHKALTQNKKAGLSKDQQMLKTVWQWRYQSLFLQKSTQIRHQQRSARRMTCTLLCLTTRQRLGWGFEKLKERLFMGRIQLTATIFKKKTAKLTKTGLRLNAKYKLERMGRLLDRGRLQILGSVLQHWLTVTVRDQRFTQQRDSLRAQVMGSVLRRLGGLMVTRAWALWSAEVREQTKHAQVVHERQLGLFRRKLERVQLRRAKAILCAAVSQSYVEALRRPFLQWSRKAQALTALNLDRNARMSLALHRLRHLMLARSWARWMVEVTAARKEGLLRARQHRKQAATKHIVAWYAHWLYRMVLRRWRWFSTNVAAHIGVQADRLKAVHVIVAAFTRTQRQWLQGSFRSWHAASLTLGQSERQSQSAQTLATAQEATKEAQRHAALLSLDHVLSQHRALSVQRRFRHWTDTVIRRNSIRRDRLQAVQMLVRTLERNAMRRQRSCWAHWIHVVDSQRQSQADAAMAALRKKLAQTQSMLRETNLMVAASVIKSALTQWGNFKLAAAFHRWQKIISTAKSQHTAQQYRVAATIRRLAERRLRQAWDRWRQIDMGRMVADAVLKLANAQQAEQAEGTHRSRVLQRCGALIKSHWLVHTRRVAFRRWQSVCNAKSLQAVAMSMMGRWLGAHITRRLQAAFLQWRQCSLLSRQSAHYATKLQSLQKRLTSLKTARKNAAAVTLASALHRGVTRALQNSWQRWSRECENIGARRRLAHAALRSTLRIVKRAFVRRAWADWRSATDDSVSQDAVRYMQLKSSRNAALRRIEVLARRKKRDRPMRRALGQWRVVTFGMRVHEATTYDRQLARLETVVLRRAETVMRRALDRWRRVALATKANDVGAHTQELQTALAQAQGERQEEMQKRRQYAFRVLMRARVHKLRDDCLRHRFTIWRGATREIQDLQQRQWAQEAAGNRLWGVLVWIHRKNLSRGWNTWRRALHRATNQEKSAKLKNQFKRMKREARRAVRAQSVSGICHGLQMWLQRALGFALHRWRLFILIHDAQLHSQRQTQLATLLTRQKTRTLTLQLSRGWLRWTVQHISSRLSAQDLANQKQAVEAARQQGRRAAVGLRLVLASRQSDQSALALGWSRWRAVIQIMVQTETLTERDLSKQQVQEERQRRAVCERNVRELKAKLTENSKQLESCRETNATRLKQLEQERDAALARQVTKMENILKIAMKEVQSMKLPPPPPPPSRPGSTAQQKKKKPRRVPSNTKPAHPETLMLQGPAVIYDNTTTKSTIKTEGVDNPVE